MNWGAENNKYGVRQQKGNNEPCLEWRGAKFHDKSEILNIPEAMTMFHKTIWQDQEVWFIITKEI